MKRIVLTGGGTAGHVTPNIALIPRLRELNYDICYIGSYDGIEKKLSKSSIFLITVFLLENYVVILIRKTFQIHLKF